MKNAYRSSVAALVASLALVAVGVTPAFASSATVAQYLANDNVKTVPGSAIAMGGSSFDAPLASAAYSVWAGQSANNANSLSAYQSHSSGTGRANLINGTYAIGFSDVPMNAAGQDTSNTSQYAQIPVALGGVALIYNINMKSSVTENAVAPATGAPVTDSLAGCTSLINSQTIILTASEIAGIFAGTITNWSNPSIEATNSKLVLKVKSPLAAASGSRAERFGTTTISCLSNLTNESIKLYDRTAGSGTTFIPSSANFGAATADESNSTGVAGAVAANDGGFGYVEQSYAAQNPALQVVRIVNSSGHIIKLTVGSVQAAAVFGLKAIDTSNCHAFSTDQPNTYVAANVNTACFSFNNQGGGAYPIAGVSYAIIKKTQTSLASGEAAVKFLEYLTQTGQSLAPANYYDSLPTSLQALAFSILKTVTVPVGNSQVQAVSTTL